MVNDNRKNELIIPEDVYMEMINHCKNNLPYEVCGFLSGENNNVKSIWPFINEWKSKSRYYVSEHIVEKCLKEISLKNEKVLAIYHTHPTTSPTPSSYDLANHPYADVSMMIVSFKQNQIKVKCFTITHSSYKERPFLTEKA